MSRWVALTTSDFAYARAWRRRALRAEAKVGRLESQNRYLREWAETGRRPLGMFHAYPITHDPPDMQLSRRPAKNA